MKAFVLLLLFSSVGWTQGVAPEVPVKAQDQGTPITVDDVLDVAVAGAPEFGGTPRVNASGFITLPQIGSFKAVGQNSNSLAREIETALGKKYLVDPNVVVSVKERAFGAISVLGTVRTAGTVQLKAPSILLLDLLAAVGGPTEGTGKTIQVLRKKPAPSAVSAPGITQSANGDQIIELSTEELFQKGNTSLNIPIYAGDVVNVLPTASVFVVGDVKTPGELPLKFGKGITIRQAIAMTGSFNSTAKQEECKIIRYHVDGTQEEIPMNLKKVMDASTNDVPLMPNDILFVPSSKGKNAFNKSLNVALGIATQRLIFIGR